MDPVEALERTAFLLEREQASPYRTKAFRTAAAAIRPLVEEGRPLTGDLTRLRGVGRTTAQVITDAIEGRVPAYLAELEARAAVPLADGGEALAAVLRGDCHMHSDWSDGTTPIEVMADTARGLGREWAVLTDHSPSLSVANGLTAERLRTQLRVVAAVGRRSEPFRLLTGIECDILEDGRLDQDASLLDELDVVVASVHSRLRADAAAMTERLLAAVTHPRVNVLGHCTGRLIAGKPRPESAFDAEAVFAACAEHRTAVEINCRPERLDPPRRLLRLALDAGCLFSLDTDAHAPGELAWYPYGCARAEEVGIPPERIITTWPAADLLAWTRER